MYIKQLHAVSRKDIKLVGGKAAMLGELINLGFNVPPGFVITTSAFQNFYNKDFPEAFINELYDSFNSLRIKRVAVRSSAIAEDSINTSWAGQLESYLNITKVDLQEAIKNCWSSIYSARANAYAKHVNLKKVNEIAVIVQAMIDSEISGVMFTANPVNKNTNEIMIEAIYGLGELLVQGEVTPDNYLFNKKEKKIIKITLGNQSVNLNYLKGKNTRIPIAQEKLKVQKLDSQQIIALAELGRELENFFGYSQDIEWAISNNKTFIIQSRPITTI